MTPMLKSAEAVQIRLRKFKREKGDLRWLRKGAVGLEEGEGMNRN